MSCKSNFSEDQYVELIINIIKNYKKKIIENKDTINKIIKSKPELNDLSTHLVDQYEKNQINDLLSKININKDDINKINNIISNKEDTKKQVDNILSDIKLSENNKELLNKIITNSQKKELDNIQISSEQKDKVNKLIDNLDMINIQKDKVSNIVSELKIPDKDKDIINNYILKNTLSNSPKYTCDIIEKYTKLDYINIAFICITTIIMIYVIYKIYTKNNINSSLNNLLTLLTIGTSALLLYKFRNLLSIIGKYYMYVYNLKEKLLILVPIFIIAISILEHFFKENMIMIKYLYLTKIVFLIASIYFVGYNIINKNYYKFIVLNISDKILSKKNINKIKTLF